MGVDIQMLRPLRPAPRWSGVGSEHPRRPLKDGARFKVAQGTAGANVHKGSWQVREADTPPPSDLTRPQPQTSPAAPPLAGDAKPGVQVSSFQTGEQKGLGSSTEKAQTSRLPRIRVPGAGARGACFQRCLHDPQKEAGMGMSLMKH